MRDLTRYIRLERPEKDLLPGGLKRFQENPRSGASLNFRFETGGSDFEVLEMTPPKRVRWKCVAGPEQWIDTRVHFDIKEEDSEAVLVFAHR